MPACTCQNEPPRPGSVRIAVFCADCGNFMGELTGDIDEQLAALKSTAEDIHTVRDVRALIAKMAAEQSAGPSRSCSHGDYEPGSVTLTEVYGDEGFRAFG